MSAPTDTLVPALTESIAIVRERDAYREALRKLGVLLSDRIVVHRLDEAQDIVSAALKGSQP